MQPFFQFALDYYWVVPLVGIALWVYRIAGWRGLAAVALLGLGGGLWTEGRRHERARAAEAAERRRQKALEDRSKIDEDIAGLDPDTKRKRLSRWLRDN